MEKILAEYEKLLDNLYKSKSQYNETTIVLQAAAKGNTYGDLMIVGRAVNGWDISIEDKNDDSDKAEILSILKDRFENWGLQWVHNRWGVNYEDGEKKYNTKTSAFWRVANELAANFSDEVPGGLYFNSIVWSNLYKAAPDSGNPSSKLRTVIFENCLNILRAEIEYFKPKYIIFLTGYKWWADMFIKGLGVTQIECPEMQFVKFTGDYNGIKIVVAQHPMRKPEEPHIEEINEMCEFIK